MNDRLLRALRREPVDRTPVWFMRQAGRSLPRYRQIRGERSMADILRDPPTAADVTALPLEYYPVDAAVLFADLSTPFEAAGLHVRMVEGVGPVVDDPIEAPSDVDRLRSFDARDELGHILEQIGLLVPRLEVPVIGFVGAPLTLCSYLIRGPRSRNLEETKAFLWSEPAAADRLLAFWAEQLAGFAEAQYEAGAAAIQVFDSWAGALEPDLYQNRVLPHSRALLERLRQAGVPTIHFSTGNPRILPLVAAAGGDALGVDWRLPIDEAWAVAGPERAVQGNLDPAALLAGEEVARERTRDVMGRVAGRPGHIFNLGHGMLPSTDPVVARAVVDEVHSFEPLPLAADRVPEAPESAPDAGG